MPVQTTPPTEARCAAWLHCSAFRFGQIVCDCEESAQTQWKLHCCAVTVPLISSNPIKATNTARIGSPYPQTGFPGRLQAAVDLNGFHDDLEVEGCAVSMAGIEYVAL